jgi:hypothetical protein
MRNVHYAAVVGQASKLAEIEMGPAPFFRQTNSFQQEKGAGPISISAAGRGPFPQALFQFQRRIGTIRDHGRGGEIYAQAALLVVVVVLGVRQRIARRTGLGTVARPRA